MPKFTVTTCMMVPQHHTSVIEAADVTQAIQRVHDAAENGTRSVWADVFAPGEFEWEEDHRITEITRSDDPNESGLLSESFDLTCDSDRSFVSDWGALAPLVDEYLVKETSNV